VTVLLVVLIVIEGDPPIPKARRIEPIIIVHVSKFGGVERG
jgi:hypothetical protein